MGNIQSSSTNRRSITMPNERVPLERDNVEFAEETKGGSKENELPGEPSFKRFKSHGSPRPDIEVSHRRKRTLRKVCELIGDCEELTSKRSKQLVPVVRGGVFDSIPNELVLEIFKYMLPAKSTFSRPFRDSLEFIKTMSLVCRRFHELVLRFHEAWSYLDLDLLRGDAVDLFLNRSKARRLSVSVDYDPEKDRNIQKVVSHKDRLAYLRISVWCYEAERFRNHPPVTFPSVTTLSIHVDYSRHSPDTIFSRWKFPNVEHVDLGNFVPPTPDSLFDRKSIKSLTFETSYGAFTDDNVYFASLTGFLRPATSLQKLSLDVSYVSDASDFNMGLAVELPGVQYFSITNSRSDGSQPYDAEDEPMTLADFAHFTKLFKLPNVREISVSLAFSEPTLDVQAFLEDAFPESNGLRDVTETRFDVQWLRREEYKPRLTLPFDVFFSRFPKMDSLSLHIPLFNLNSSLGALEVPPEARFRALSIEGYDGPPKYVYQLCKDLHGKDIRIEEFSIESKFDLNERSLRKSLPYASICYSQGDKATVGRHLFRI